MPDRPISVVIPAHNEASVIGRLLAALSDRTDHDEIVVVCDGCTDSTSAVAREHSGVRVIEQESAGKTAALNAGEAVCTVFPRFYVDADITVTMATLREAAGAMVGGVVAGAPSLSVETAGCTWTVRQFYDIWTRLPYARSAVFGSGVMGVSATGRQRFACFPDVIADDDFLRRLFHVSERVAATAGVFRVFPPRTVGSLVRTKARSRLGILQLDRLYGRANPMTGLSGRHVLMRLLRDPARLVPLGVFAMVRVMIGVRARWRLATGHIHNWDRDESARTGVVRKV